MAEQKRGMGRGLAAILSVSPAEHEPKVREVPVDLIQPSPRQPRRHFDEEALVALADSVREKGLLQPVLVREAPDGRYELIAGERRWRAARLAGLDVMPAAIRSDGDIESLELALIENMAREDLNPVEEARACAALVEELGLTRESVGKRVGRSRVAVSNLLRLLDLPDEVLDLLESGKLTEGHGRAVLMCTDHGARKTLAAEAATGGWSVRETEARARAAGDAPAPRRRRRPRGLEHPDEIAAAAEAADALGSIFGAEVKVTRRAGGYRAEIALESLDDALALAERLSRRPAA